MTNDAVASLTLWLAAPRLAQAFVHDHLQDGTQEVSFYPECSDCVPQLCHIYDEEVVLLDALPDSTEVVAA